VNQFTHVVGPGHYLGPMTRLETPLPQRAKAEVVLGGVLGPADPIYFGARMFFVKHNFISIPFILFIF